MKFPTMQISFALVVRISHKSPLYFLKQLKSSINITYILKRNAILVPRNSEFRDRMCIPSICGKWRTSPKAIFLEIRWKKCLGFLPFSLESIAMPLSYKTRLPIASIWNPLSAVKGNAPTIILIEDSYCIRY